MSWVRWGSKCDQGWPFRQSPCSAAPLACPGSSVYVYSHADGAFHCCCGGEVEEDFRGTEPQMIAHLRDHVAKGDHVPLSLLA